MSIIRQYLSNINENVIVFILQKKIKTKQGQQRPGLVRKNFQDSPSHRILEH